jgi:glutathione synthase/RimK-type ligase-like ATP-grasp enzyme
MFTKVARCLPKSLFTRSFATASLKQQPFNPTRKVVFFEVEGGTDKGADGHRRDTIPFCNSLIEKNVHAEWAWYKDADHDALFERYKDFDGFVPRINPATDGQYEGVTNAETFKFMDRLSKSSLAMPHLNVMTKMGAKDALVKINDLSVGLEDTYAYYDVESWHANFMKVMDLGHTRVIKQNRGSQGEGIWIVRFDDPNTTKCTVDTKLHLMEAYDNHTEVMTAGEFMKFCEQYIEGENGQLIDQRFCPRITEGEVRVLFFYKTPIEVVHKVPAEGGLSATLASGAKYTSYACDEPMFKNLLDGFIGEDLPKIMPRLGMENTALPLIWTGDFILGDKDAKGDDTYVIGEFNCSCVGVTQQLHLTPQVADAVITVLDEHA